MKSAILLLWREIKRTGLRLSRPLVILCLGAISGILLSDHFSGISPMVWGIAAGILLLICFKVTPSRPKLFLAGLIVFGFLQSNAANDPVRTMMDARGGRPLSVHVVGLVDGEPELDPSGTTWRFPLTLESVQEQACGPSQVLVRLRATTAPEYGDRISLLGQLQQPGPPRNPGEFDWAYYIRRQGFAAELEILSPALVQIIEHTGGNLLVRSSMRARDWIGSTVTADLMDDPDIAATVRTMVLGTQESTPQDVEDAFVESGTMHIFAVSGLHVALFGLILWQLLRLLRVPRTAVVMLVIPLMFFYVYVTGLRPSAWRAAFMASVILIGPLVNRNGNVFNSLGFACLFVLAWNPQQLFQAGFQLSFGVVFMLALLTQPLLQRFAHWYELDPFIPHGFHSRWQQWSSWMKRRFSESLVVSICATLGSAPLMIYHFGLLTPIGIVANLFLVLLSTIILTTACLSLLCSGVQLTWLALWVNNANWLFTKTSIFLAKVFASIPGGHVRVNPSHWFDESTARLTVLSIRGGGAASHLDFKGQHWLLDTGPSGTFLRTQRPYLLRYPVRKLRGVVLSHRDADHVGGTKGVAETFPLDAIFASPTLTAPLALQPHFLTLNETFSPHPAASFTVLYPPPHMAYGPADDQCLVIRLEIDGWRLLFTSDAGFIAEKWLLENNIDIRAHVLVKGRHADDFSGIPEFINAVKPQVICFTNHRFPAEQHVPSSWIERLQTRGISFFDQNDSGAVEMSLSAESLTLRGFVDGKTISLTDKEPQPPFTAIAR